MPKRLIQEVDNTGAVQLSAISNTTYIPGKTKGETAIEPKLFKSASELEDVKSSYVDDLSFKLAKRLLSLGIYVVFEGIKPAGSTVAATDINWSKLKNKTQFDIRFLTTGGYACPSDAMISCAADRGDCVALLDHPKTLTIPTDSSMVKEVRKYFEALNGTSTINADPNSFAAAFTPWFTSKTKDLGATDQAEVEIPASFGYLFAYARSIKNNPSWLPIAGAARGNIPELSGVTHEYSEADIEVLQARGKDGVVELGTDDTPFLENDNVGKAINPIAFLGESFGYLIWGNRTLRENDAAKRTIATSFLNVRNLCSELKKAMEKASLKYTFEPNNDILWINWQSQVTPVLNRMESGSGILGYKLIRQKTTAKARLKAKCILVPVEGVEDFELKVQMEDSLSIAE